MFKQDDQAAWVSNMWDQYDNQRSKKKEQWLELRNYIFATDISTTSNSALPWKNSTTLPKICQIRDNLHSNYLSSLFPNDRWLRWLAYSKDAAKKSKAKAIEAYMENKTREGGFREEVSKLLLDYIDYGNAFTTSRFESNYKTLADGSVVPAFVGPKAVRISPLDLVFNPMADSFENSPKIIRSIKSIGELRRIAQTDPDQNFWEDAIERRLELQKAMTGVSKEDFQKAVGYAADGFGDMYSYYLSDHMEILEFYGDTHNSETGELKTNQVVTVVDRSVVVRQEDIPTWMGTSPIRHVGWRIRQDNLWAMGPLDNLVGMQYRIDHLENLKADAMDLTIHPPLAISGEVEEFVWGPGVEIHIGEGGAIAEVTKSLQPLFQAKVEIDGLMQTMEEMAGAPREAMGIRTPGEKTAFEVGQLGNAAGRIFQEKVTSFEISLLEKTLNDMLETAARNMDSMDVIRVFDDTLGVQQFKEITKADITANGVLRPIGARHFAKQAQDLQNLIGIMNSPMKDFIAPHTSGIALTKFIDDTTGLKGYEIFKTNIAIEEQKATQESVNMAEEDMAAQAQVPVGEE